MPTPAEAVQALIDVRIKIERLALELEEAKAERKDLEELILPPLFLQARQTMVGLDNGAQARKSLYAYARLAKEGPKRKAMLEWLDSVGEQSSIKTTLTAQWERGDYDAAKRAYDHVRGDNSAIVTLEEKIDWQTLQAIVLARVKKGEIVPLDEIGATVGDHVTITKWPKV